MNKASGNCLIVTCILSPFMLADGILLYKMIIHFECNFILVNSQTKAVEGKIKYVINKITTYVIPESTRRVYCRYMESYCIVRIIPLKSNKAKFYDVIELIACTPEYNLSFYVLHSNFYHVR